MTVAAWGSARSSPRLECANPATDAWTQNLTGGVDVEKGGVEDDGCTALVSPLPVVEAGRPPRRSWRLRRS